MGTGVPGGGPAASPSSQVPRCTQAETGAPVAHGAPSQTRGAATQSCAGGDGWRGNGAPWRERAEALAAAARHHHRRAHGGRADRVPSRVRPRPRPRSGPPPPCLLLQKTAVIHSVSVRGLTDTTDRGGAESHRASLVGVEPQHYCHGSKPDPDALGVPVCGTSEPLGSAVPTAA